MSHVSVAEAHARPGIENPKLGMWFYLVTEVMLFSGLIGSFYSMQARSPANANEVLNIPLTAINTFVLIVSSTAVVYALAAAQDGKQGRLRLWLLITLVLGGLFLGIQLFEYNMLWREGFTPMGSLFGSGFYALTGWHGFHVFVGLLWVAGLNIWAWRGRIPPSRSMLVEIFGLYWHFVDIVWIVLFTIVYLI